MLSLISSTPTRAVSILTVCASEPDASSYERCTVKNDLINDAELVRLGIERIQTEIYRWGGFRYTNLSDAVAAAKRAQR